MKVGHCSSIRTLYSKNQPRSHRGRSHIRQAVSRGGSGAGSAWPMQLSSSGGRTPMVTRRPQRVLLLGHFCTSFGVGLVHCQGGPPHGLPCWAGGPGKDKLVFCRIGSLTSLDVCILLKYGPSLLRDVPLHLRRSWPEFSGAEFVNFPTVLEIPRLHFGYHNNLEKAVKYSGECLFSFLLFPPF